MSRTQLVANPVLVSLLGISGGVWAFAGCTGANPPPMDTAQTVLANQPVTFEATGPIACADPSIRTVTKFVNSELRAERAKKAWFWGGGLIAGDFDADGLHDLVLPGFWETPYFRGIGGGLFQEVPGHLPFEGTLGSGGTAADYDGDGDLDLLITRFLAPNVLLRNDGGAFVDVSVAAGLSADSRRSMTSSWADFDRDGDLDLYIGCYGFVDESGEDPNHDDFEPAEPAWLYVNNGEGTFTDASDRLPAEVHDGYSLAGGWHDLDRDGWMDLYAVHDFGRSYPNRLLWNDHGTLVLDNNAHGLDIAITGMGLGVGDLNGDGVDDLVMSAWDGNHAMVSGAGGRAWFESVANLGLQNDLSRAQKIAWGTELADVDNDGDLDVPMAYGFLAQRYQASRTQPDALYLQHDDGTFEDVGALWGANHPIVSRGFAVIDLNRDGYLDLVKRDLDGPTLVQVATCGSDAWLRVSLSQPGMNRFAVGARVDIRDGGKLFSRTIAAGGMNHATGGPPEVHFGLGDRDSVAQIAIHWPDGRVSALQDVDTRQILEIRRDD